MVSVMDSEWSDFHSVLFLGKCANNYVQANTQLIWAKKCWEITWDWTSGLYKEPNSLLWIRAV